MSRQIIKQPDDNFCVFSSITDTFIITDATKEELIEILAKEAAVERIGMPLISAMAHKNLSNRPDYHKIGQLNQNQTITKATCSVCNQTYSLEPTKQTIEKLPKLYHRY